MGKTHLFLLSLFFLQRHTYYFLTFATLWANSADNKLVIVFLFFLETGLKFHANCLGDSLHVMSNPVFWENKKKYFKMSPAEKLIQSGKH